MFLELKNNFINKLKDLTSLQTSALAALPVGGHNYTGKFSIPKEYVDGMLPNSALHSLRFRPYQKIILSS